MPVTALVPPRRRILPAELLRLIDLLHLDREMYAGVNGGVVYRRCHSRLGSRRGAALGQCEADNAAEAQHHDADDEAPASLHELEVTEIGHAITVPHRPP